MSETVAPNETCDESFVPVIRSALLSEGPIGALDRISFVLEEMLGEGAEAGDKEVPCATLSNHTIMGFRDAIDAISGHLNDEETEMKERDATDGTKLHALIVSMVARNSFVRQLATMHRDSPKSWETRARDLKQSLIEAMPPTP